MNGENANQGQEFSKDEEKAIRLAKRTLRIVAALVEHKDRAEVEAYLKLQGNSSPTEETITANLTPDMRGLNLHDEAVAIGRLGAAIFTVLWQAEG